MGLFCFEEELTSKWGFIRNNINNKENTMLWKGRRESSKKTISEKTIRVRSTGAVAQIVLCHPELDSGSLAKSLT